MKLPKNFKSWIEFWEAIKDYPGDIVDVVEPEELSFKITNLEKFIQPLTFKKEFICLMAANEAVENKNNHVIDIEDCYAILNMAGRTHPKTQKEDDLVNKIFKILNHLETINHK